jgi:hypothetical protein
MDTKLWGTALVVVLIATACSGSSDASNTTGPSVTGGEESTPTVAETSDSAPEDAADDGAGDGGTGDFSLLMVANVDELTASGTLESLQEAGFDGFVMEGSVEEGFDVYNPGLTNDEATVLLTEIFAVPGVSGGLIFETANLP